MSAILEFLRQFFTSAQTVSILVLILLDVILGIAAAIKCGEFDWRKVAQFYRTNVIPYVLGYGVSWSLIHYGLVEFVPQEWLVEVIETFFFGFIAVGLGASILDHLKALGYQGEPPSE